MNDNRIGTLAENLVNYSTHIEKGNKVLIEVTGQEEELAKELIRAVYRAGGQPYYAINNERLQKEWLKGKDDDGIDEAAVSSQARWESARMSDMDAYIGIRIKDNLYDLAGIPDQVMTRYNKLFVKPVHLDIRVPKTKWVILRYPNPAMAQEAGMSTEDFTNFYFKVCNFDYQLMSKRMDPLVEILNNAKEVQIKAPSVDLRFSIEGIPAVKCDGIMNIPDGEVFTAPVKDSVEGEITFNTPSPHDGKVYNNIKLQFTAGKIVNAECPQDSEALNAVLDTDEGSRYIGEFAFGLHPLILQPIHDILFDEKISGSFHFTPGACYDEADNGNKSAVHWDMIYIMRSEYGGGEIYLDNQLIQKDGLFCHPSLVELNPQSLLTACNCK